MESLNLISHSGGGLLGKWSVYLLAKLEEDLDIKFKDIFDAFAGTSVGSIITASYMIDNLPLSKVFEIFMELGNIVFKKQLRMNKKAFLLARGKTFYDREDLQKNLVKYLGETKFSDIKNEKIFFMSAVSVTDYAPRNFSINYLEEKDTPEEKIVSAVLASAMVPFYFDEVEGLGEHLLVDGGLAYINPAGDMVAPLVKKYSHINVLSIAPPTFTYPIYPKIRGLKRMSFLMSSGGFSIQENRSYQLTTNLVGKENALFSRPTFAEAIDFDWVCPNRFDKFFNHYYYLERERIATFLKEKGLVPIDKEFKFKQGETCSLDILIEKYMKMYEKKEVKDNVNKFYEKLI